VGPDPERGATFDAFGCQVRRLRRDARLTQEQLAAKSGISVRTIQQIEGGRVRRPHPESVRLLAAALGVTGAERDRFDAAARAGFAADRRTRDRRAAAPAADLPVLTRLCRADAVALLTALIGPPAVDDPHLAGLLAELVERLGLR
jgi:transcriptional regulator with XRE-family HTH domain